ncbi:MAG: serine acetyltransferase [Bacteroidota bacterium]|nr:serine acetyltransferase [Bacteroidota bacterium]
MNNLKYLLTPLLIPHLFCYFLFENKDFIKADILVFSKKYGYDDQYGTISKLIKTLLFYPEYRNVFYKRIGGISKKLHIGFLLETLLPGFRFLWIGTPGEKIGKGLFIEHGNSTIIYAKSIGDYCWINQNVSIGESGKGIPQIGSNVRIGTGAVVLGPITIGDNVIIGANATVVKDVPANCTVVPSPSYIIRRDGMRVTEKL